MKITKTLLDVEDFVSSIYPAGTVPVAVGIEEGQLYVYLLVNEETDFPDIQLQFTVYVTDETATGVYIGTVNAKHVFYIETPIEDEP